MEGPACLSLSPLHTHSPRTPRESVSLSPPSLIAQQPGAVTLRAAGKMSLPRPGFFPLHPPRTSPPSSKLRTQDNVDGGLGSPLRPRRVREPRGSTEGPRSRYFEPDPVSSSVAREARGCCFALLFAMATDLRAPTSTPHAHALAPHAHTPALPAPHPPNAPSSRRVR